MFSRAGKTTINQYMSFSDGSKTLDDSRIALNDSFEEELANREYEDNYDQVFGNKLKRVEKKFDINKFTPIYQKSEKQNSKKESLSMVFKSTTTREAAGKIYKLAPSIQRIGGANREDPKNIPSLYHYNPCYKAVDSRVKGDVKFKRSLKKNKILQKRKEFLQNYTVELKKKLAIKETRMSYVNSLLTKFKKCKKNYVETTQKSRPKEKLGKGHSLISESSDGETLKAQSLAKININSTSAIKTEGKGDSEIQRMKSLSHFTSNHSTAPESHQKPVRRVNMSKKSRINEDIVKWCFRKANFSFDSELSPYDLKMKLFNSPEESTIMKERCKSVTPFDKQQDRPPLKAEINCNEKRFEVNSSNIHALSNSRKSASPDFKKCTRRKELFDTPFYLNTYDANYEYPKSSLGKVPDFKRYISRPPQEKEIIYQEYYKPLEKIYASMKRKDRTVAFRNQRSRDDLLYRHETVARQARKNILDSASLMAKKINF
ncbi:unnamed protein product [Moneuplotes crassus]|uniref:Uncharacterized protein n=1 Tax=Euplotes crassus TaxID=5936 RepID=A0AAD1U9Y6_EUPCR|nr:unnamed protein product [Moneuplotes crassus]